MGGEGTRWNGGDESERRPRAAGALREKNAWAEKGRPLPVFFAAALPPSHTRKLTQPGPALVAGWWRDRGGVAAVLGGQREREGQTRRGGGGRPRRAAALPVLPLENRKTHPPTTPTPHTQHQHRGRHPARQGPVCRRPRADSRVQHVSAQGAWEEREGGWVGLIAPPARARGVLWGPAHAGPVTRAHDGQACVCPFQGECAGDGSPRWIAGRRGERAFEREPFLPPPIPHYL